MKKHLILGATILISLMISVTPSVAIQIGFDPVSQDVLLGNPADVGIVISGLGEFAAPSLGAFDLDISFDPTILSFHSLVFGDPVLGDQLDLFGLGSITGVDPVSTPGVVDFFQISLDLATDLDTLQFGSFTLATLTFDTLSIGTSPLNITSFVLSDSIGNALAANVESGNISPVPEPATIMLLASGLAGLGVFSRRKIKK